MDRYENNSLPEIPNIFTMVGYNDQYNIIFFQVMQKLTMKWMKNILIILMKTLHHLLINIMVNIMIFVNKLML